MPRPARLIAPGHLYHLTARGVDGVAIVRDDEDRARLIRLLNSALARAGATYIAFCLMHNHLHLLGRSGPDGLSRAMQLLLGVYAGSFNWRHGRTGHLFQGRFYSSVVADDAYLLASVRYVLMNPVRARLCAHPGEWEWSSYQETVGLREPAPGLEADFLRALQAEYPGWIPPPKIEDPAPS